MTTPIKRHILLQPLSRDHHDALLLCWKIRKGISLNIDPGRIQRYVDWFFVNHLLPHFNIEEEYLFPLAENDGDHIKQALSEHYELVQLFKVEDKDNLCLTKIADQLEAHIRFEERILFNEIQSHATDEQMKTVASLHSTESFCDNETDKFWQT